MALWRCDAVAILTMTLVSLSCALVVQSAALRLKSVSCSTTLSTFVIRGSLVVHSWFTRDSRVTAIFTASTSDPHPSRRSLPLNTNNASTRIVSYRLYSASTASIVQRFILSSPRLTNFDRIHFTPATACTATSLASSVHSSRHSVRKQHRYNPRFHALNPPLSSTLCRTPTPPCSSFDPLPS